MTAPPPDPAFPALHIRPPRGWLNDPNGVCRIDGRYHVFFQHNPDAPRHEAIQWGHSSSGDLLEWRDEPPALRPRPGRIDQHGCWSGCVVDDGGVPTAVYTAVPDTAQHAATVLARSDRSLLEWQQDEGSVMGAPDDPAVSDVRDPFVFVFDGHRYAVQGAGHAQLGGPQLLLYGCDDLTAWTPLGPLLTGDDPVAARVAPAHIWECPNLVEVDGRWVLVLSLWQLVDGAEVLAGVRYLLGRLAPSGPGLRFTPTSGGPVDEGPAFYAPQALVEPDRVLLWGWSAEHGRPAEDVAAAGWAGVLTFPRELGVSGERLVCRPARELTGLRRGELPTTSGTHLAASAFELSARAPLELVLVSGQHEVVVVDVDASPEHPVTVLVDGSLVEVFSDGAARTSRAYPGTGSRWLVRTGGEDVTAWRLGR